MKTQIEYDRDLWIATEVRKLRREVNEMKFNQPITIKETGGGISSFVAVANGSNQAIFITYTAADDRVLLPTPLITLYRDSASGINKYPNGANWSVSEINNTKFEQWIDWHDSDTANVKHYIVFANNSGSSITIGIIGSLRYLNAGGAPA